MGCRRRVGSAKFGRGGLAENNGAGFAQRPHGRIVALGKIAAKSLAAHRRGHILGFEQVLDADGHAVAGAGGRPACQRAVLSSAAARAPASLKARKALTIGSRFLIISMQRSRWARGLSAPSRKRGAESWKVSALKVRGSQLRHGDAHDHGRSGRIRARPDQGARQVGLGIGQVARRQARPASGSASVGQEGQEGSGPSQGRSVLPASARRRAAAFLRETIAVPFMAVKKGMPRRVDLAVYDGNEPTRARIDQRGDASQLCSAQNLSCQTFDPNVWLYIRWAGSNQGDL